MELYNGTLLTFISKDGTEEISVDNHDTIRSRIVSEVELILTDDNYQDVDFNKNHKFLVEKCSEYYSSSTKISPTNLAAFFTNLHNFAYNYSSSSLLGSYEVKILNFKRGNELGNKSISDIIFTAIDGARRLDNHWHLDCSVSLSVNDGYNSRLITNVNYTEGEDSSWVTLYASSISEISSDAGNSNVLVPVIVGNDNNTYSGTLIFNPNFIMSE